MLITTPLFNVERPLTVVVPVTLWLPFTDSSPETKLPVVDKLSDPNDILPVAEEICPVIKLPAVTEPCKSEFPTTVRESAKDIEFPEIAEVTLRFPPITVSVPTFSPADKVKLSAPKFLIVFKSLLAKPMELFSSKISPLLNVKVPIVVPASNTATVPDFLMYSSSANVSVKRKSICGWISPVTPLK